MTFDTIVAEICDRLNYTSTVATTRVGKRVNERYRRVTTSIGMETSRRVVVSQAATIGNRVITFTSVEKLLDILDKSDPENVIVLNRLTVDEMNVQPLVSEPPRNYAITNVHSTSVTVELDCTPTTAFLLYADAQVIVADLSGSTEPDFPQSFHDILVFGALADEYRKLEKQPFYRDAEADYERRLSDLRMWIAKNAYLDVVQGKYAENNRWRNRGMNNNTL